MKRTIKIHVCPRSKKEEIREFDNGYKVKLTQAPEDGKANRALIKLLAEYFNLKKSDISIINGKKSKNKLIMLNK